MIRPQQVVLIIILIVSEFVKGSKNIYVLKVVLTSGGPFYNPDQNTKKYFLPNYKEFLILDHFKTVGLGICVSDASQLTY